MAASDITTVTFEYEQASCTLDGYQEVLRDTDFTEVSLFRVTPAAAFAFARFRRGISHISTNRNARTSSSPARDEVRDGTIGEVSAEESPSRRRDSAEPAREFSNAGSVQLILKSFKDEELFADEVQAYKMMERIQGTVVPEFYGSGSFCGRPTIAIEYITGKDFYDHENDLASLPRLARAVEDCFRRISECGVLQWDPRLDGMIVTDPSRLTVRMIDFSHVKFTWSPPDKWPLEKIFKINAASSKYIMRNYGERMGWKLDDDPSTWQW
jgi:hypothetical protein